MQQLAVSIICVVMLAACGKSKGGKELAQEVCDCSKKANAMPVTDTGRTKAQADCSVMQGEAWTKIKDKPEEADAFNKVLSQCASEQIKEAFNK